MGSDTATQALQKLLIVVPTRNRPELALNAITSILESDESSIEVMVSDNSTVSAYVDQVAQFVAQCGDQRLFLYRPPEPLAMTPHWDWALALACERPGVSHVVVLTDRMIFKRDALTALREISAHRPGSIISYNHDRIVDHRLPMRVELQEWTDEVLSVQSETLLELSSRCVFPQALPRLLNCVTPVSVLQAVERECGNYVGSISPDYSFCYRALSLVPDIIFWDRSPIVHYALARSNGESTARGVETSDSVDFLRAAAVPMCSRAPMPGVFTLVNAMLHEYVVARDETMSASFPAIDKRVYVDHIDGELALMENKKRSSEMVRQVDAFRMREGLPRETAPMESRSVSYARNVLRKAGVGPRVLHARQRLHALLVPPRLETDPPLFDELDSALAYARSHDGQQLLNSEQHLLYLKGRVVDFRERGSRSPIETA